VTWARGELVLAVLIMVAGTIHLQAMGKGKADRTWAGLLGSGAVVLVGLVVFLSGLHDLRIYL
jgi:hypothetical protein